MAAPLLREQLRAPLLTGAAGAALAASVVLHDPHVPGSWPVCPFLRLTGVPCPGCGGLRAAHDLLTGSWTAAASENVYAVVTALLVCGGYVAWLLAASQGRRPAWADRLPVVTAVWAAGLLVFGAARLLPALSVLRP
ncbi:DUF2752 domain-containing protein [Pedococcus sp. 5OH_020]|uniref:DUF2752 domain-containing protein n=1 Tax=Pedococcus sp. 5OH_020 TaxID=2989814 RepID=UPI0022E9CEA3|nr:DUF2752 domain-containing protein [Pedococcus sp. 5OH_020]